LGYQSCLQPMCVRLLLTDCHRGPENQRNKNAPCLRDSVALDTHYPPLTPIGDKINYVSALNLDFC